MSGQDYAALITAAAGLVAAVTALVTAIRGKGKVQELHDKVDAVKKKVEDNALGNGSGRV